jgi:N-acetylglutamate synthase-like GNAT family acetyltransferase
MGGSTTSERDELLAFDEVRTESWGRLFLTPSQPLIWDANWVAIERTGLGAPEVLAIADEALGAAGCAHRTAAVLDACEGRRIAEEVEAEKERRPGWEVERIRYMVWRGYDEESEQAGDAVDAREVRLEEIEGLRRKIIAAEALPPGVPEPEETLEQLYAEESRFAAAAGDRWFVAPAEGEPVSACCLLQVGSIAQVENVGTLEQARERGYGKAIVRAAIAAAQASGATTIFLTADAADWPQLMYARLGFEAVGDLTVLRKRP